MAAPRARGLIRSSRAKVVFRYTPGDIDLGTVAQGFPGKRRDYGVQSADTSYRPPLFSYPTPPVLRDVLVDPPAQGFGPRQVLSATILRRAFQEHLCGMHAQLKCARTGRSDLPPKVYRGYTMHADEPLPAHALRVWVCNSNRSILCPRCLAPPGQTPLCIPPEGGKGKGLCQWGSPPHLGVKARGRRNLGMAIAKACPTGPNKSHDPSKHTPEGGGSQQAYGSAVFRTPLPFGNAHTPR